MPSTFLESRCSLLRRRPLVVGTLTGRHDVAGQLRRASSPFLDLIEVRLDTFSAVYSSGGTAFAAGLLSHIRRRARKPLLLTLRSHTERGVPAPERERRPDAWRESVLAPLLPAAALVDVEARRPEFARRVGSFARRLGVGVIHSFHDFKAAASRPVLDRWCARARKAGADIFKAAITPKDAGQLSDFLSWGPGQSGIQRVLIGMGPAGAPSRTIGFTFGSVLTYGHLGRAAAPGQLPAADLGRAVREIYGR